MSEFLRTITGSGSITLIILAFLTYFLRPAIKNFIIHTYSKHLEEHKTVLRNSEKLFERQLEALSVLCELYYSCEPSPRYQGMDWDDACIEIARRFSSLELELNQYLGKYAAVLTSSSLSLLVECQGLCAWGKLEVDRAGEVTNEGTKMADQLHTKLGEARTQLQASIDELSHVPH